MSETETVWVTGYWRKGTFEIGGIFRDELTARFTCSGVVVLDHHKEAIMFEVPFDVVLDLDTTEPENTYYFTKDDDGEVVCDPA